MRPDAGSLRATSRTTRDSDTIRPDYTSSGRSIVLPWGCIMSPKQPSIRSDDVVDDRMAAILAAKSPSERLAIGHGMWRSARNMIRHMLRAQHPDWNEGRIERETARRLSHGAV